jgi:hypothetical protein
MVPPLDMLLAVPLLEFLEDGVEAGRNCGAELDLFIELLKVCLPDSKSPFEAIMPKLVFPIGEGSAGPPLAGECRDI